MPRGGYRKPSNPAPVSGPGAQSRRTDGGPGQAARYMSGGEYGEGQEMMELQQGATMASSGGQTPMSAAAPAKRPMRQGPDLFEPSERPEEPLTAGSPVGPGGGPEILSGGFGTAQSSNQGDMKDLKEYLPSLMRMANQPGVPGSFVKFVRYLRDA